MMNQNELYHIFTNTTERPDLSAYGVKNTDDREIPRARTIFEAQLTEKEFAKIFGEDRAITWAMCRESHDDNNFTIRIFASDVLACESSRNSHQAQLINILREKENLPEIDHSFVERHARSYDDIKPRMLQILLDAAAESPYPDYLEGTEPIRQMEEHGLTIDDLIPLQALREFAA